jgi:phosphoribosylformylglycinamidine synthase
MPQVKAIVLTGYGLNCDYETIFALELAGAEARGIHINSLIDRSCSLFDYDMLVFGGGFSWGDDHGAGVVQAVRLKTNIGEDILRFIDSGRLVIGICNGFQTLVNLGLLPGLDGDYRARQVALIYNDCGNFRDAWVHLTVNSQSPCVFTRNLNRLELPVRHGEGKFYAEPALIDRLIRGEQVVLRYASPSGQPAAGQFPFNPNGSIEDIAGICDPTGRVFGLMPHPEAYNHLTNHPDWSRQLQARRRLAQTDSGMEPLGIKLFANAVAYLQNR